MTTTPPGLDFMSMGQNTGQSGGAMNPLQALMNPMQAMQMPMQGLQGLMGMLSAPAQMMQQDPLMKMGMKYDPLGSMVMSGLGGGGQTGAK